MKKQIFIYIILAIFVASTALALPHPEEVYNRARNNTDYLWPSETMQSAPGAEDAALYLSSLMHYLGMGWCVARYYDEGERVDTQFGPCVGGDPNLWNGLGSRAEVASDLFNRSVPPGEADDPNLHWRRRWTGSIGIITMPESDGGWGTIQAGSVLVATNMNSIALLYCLTSSSRSMNQGGGQQVTLRAHAPLFGGNFENWIYNNSDADYYVICYEPYYFIAAPGDGPQHKITTEAK
jgi:hypothetical protein